MRIPGLIGAGWIALGLVSTACTAALETQSAYISPDSAASTAYDCSYYTKYNDLATCQSETGATCLNELDSFPNGVTSTCYYPPAGSEACSVTPATWDWIYTNPSWCDTNTSDSYGEIYKQRRSLIGCSSSVCTCTSPLQLTVYCAGNSTNTEDLNPSAPAGTQGCANFSPNPIATPAATPDPSATPTPTIPMCTN